MGWAVPSPYMGIQCRVGREMSMACVKTMGAVIVPLFCGVQGLLLP